MRALRNIRSHRRNAAGFAVNSAGFTLLEIILSMLIFGTLAVALSVGFMSAVDGYVMTREVSALSQRAEMALARMSAELRTMTAVPLSSADVDDDKLTFAAERHEGNWSVLELTGGRLTLTNPTAGGGTATGALITGVNLQNAENLFEYFQVGDTGTDVAWNPDGGDLARLYKIVITLRLDRPDAPGETLLFQTAVCPSSLTGQPKKPEWR